MMQSLVDERSNKVLQQIEIKEIASYPSSGAILSDLRAINFIFGTNGTGKTTISRVISDPEQAPSCTLGWKNGRPLERLVYNRDFVDRNYAPQLPGIFTLGETEKDTLEKIEQAKNHAQSLEETISGLTATLGSQDQSSGKRGDLKALRAKLETDCWSQIKNKHDGHFKEAFSGLRNSQSRFCDRVLAELDGNAEELEELEKLKERASSLFDQTLEPCSKIENIDPRPLIEMESHFILAKKIVGKEDVDVAA